LPAFLFLIVGCLVSPSLALAQGQRPEVQAIRLGDADTIVLDGAPDEAVWQRA